MSNYQPKRTRAQESRAAIERLYIAMRHLFIRGSYKPLGTSGEAIINALLTLRPEIYGMIADPERVELEGLLYVFERLPKGIEECRYIKLISREGFEHSNFKPIVPPRRRRNCYRIDEEQMYIEMTRGRSDIYDILTHLTFMYVESEKIRRNSQDYRNQQRREWIRLEEIVQQEANGEEFDREVAYTYLSAILGRTFDEVTEAAERFEESPNVNSLFHITYWLGRRSMEEFSEHKDREISFSSALRETVGHHLYGEQWADKIKQCLRDNGLFDRPLHIISSNPHSVMNSLYAHAAIGDQFPEFTLGELAREISRSEDLRRQIGTYAQEHGMIQIEDTSGTNITAQIFDLSKLDSKKLPAEIKWKKSKQDNPKPVILVMDYAFGEQAYETMDELLKPLGNEEDNLTSPLPVASVSIMGKAGILEGEKGDIMIPTAHVFEGTADNYPFENQLTKSDFEGNGLRVFEGSMVTVLGTSLQNKDVLTYFLRSSWKAIGLEMEGAHYQKAIQAAARIRRGIQADVVIRYAYYASDNPLITGHTLASGGLGLEGVKPTYLITIKILNCVLDH